MTKTKLVAIDIDGTLLTDDRKLLANTIQDIGRIKEKKIKVVLTTGRPLISVVDILNKLDLNNHKEDYVINYNGALITRTDGKVLFKKNLSFQDFVTIDNLSHLNNILMIAQTSNSIISTYRDLNPYVTFESFKNHLPIHIRTIPELRQMIDKISIFKILFLDKKRRLDLIQKIVERYYFQKYSFSRTESYSLDLLPLNVDKGRALAILAHYLKIKPSEIIAIGNSDNDLPMFHFAGLGIAVQNSTTKLLKNADLITDSNNCNGVGKILRKLV